MYIFYIIMYFSNFKYINICIFISFFLNYETGEDVVRRASRIKSHSPLVGEAVCKVSGSLIPVPASSPRTNCVESLRGAPLSMIIL